MINEKMMQNANKVTFLIQQYPEHNLTQIIGLLGMPSIEINTAIWVATEQGMITEPTPEGKVLLGKNVPSSWEFGPEVKSLMDMLKYAFKELAKKEQDLEENYVSNWTLGYNTHDVMIALLHLVNIKAVATYQLTDPNDLESTYTFYSSYPTGKHMWGRSQFKQEPTGEEVAVELEEPGTPENLDEPETTETTTIDPDQTTLI